MPRPDDVRTPEGEEARVEARTRLTSVLTDLELIRIRIGRLPTPDPPAASAQAALLGLAEDALQEGRTLAELLRGSDGRATPVVSSGPARRQPATAAESKYRRRG